MMKHPQSARRLLSLFSILIAATSLWAQPENLRMTRPVIRYPLPDHVRIESEASNGATTLVVWGGTVNRTQFEYRTSLFCQAVRDGSAIGEPRVLHSDRMEPARFVRVVPLSNGFRVFWSDLRSDSAGLYSKFVSMEGLPDGTAQFLFPSPIVKAESIGEQEWPLLLHRKAGNPLLLDEAGTVSELQNLPNLTVFPSLLSSDSSLLFIRSDSIVLYRSLLDAEPAFVSSYSTDDQVLPTTRRLARTPAGTYRCLYITHGFPAERNSDWGSEVVWRLTDDRISSVDGSIRKRSVLDSVESRAGAGYIFEGWIALRSAGSVRLCDAIQMYVEYTENSKTIGEPVHSTDRSAYFEVKGETVRRITSREYDRYGGCPAIGRLRRVASETNSVVELALPGGDTERVSMPLAAVDSQFANTGPALLFDGERILMTHKSELNLGRVDLRECFFNISDPEQQRALGSYPRVGRAGTSLGYLHDSYGTLLGWLITQRYEGSSRQPPLNAWWQTYLAPTSAGWDTVVSESGGYITDGHYTPTERYPAAYVQDVDNGNRLLVSESRKGYHCYGIDTERQITWKREPWPFRLFPKQLALFEEDRFVTVSPEGMAYRFQQTSFIDSISLGSTGTDLRIYRVADQRLVVCDRFREEGMLRLRLFDESLRLLGTTKIHVRDSTTGITVTSNEIGTKIALLVGSDVGLYLTVFTDALEPILSDLNEPMVSRRITTAYSYTAAPAALFRNDTLYMCWEDHRLGYAQINGAVLKPTSYVTSFDERPEPGDRTGPSRSVSVSPNPTSGTISIGLERVASGIVQIRVTDLTGRTFFLSEPTVHSAGYLHQTFDTDLFPSGSYRLSVHRNGRIIGSTMILVRH